LGFVHGWAGGALGALDERITLGGAGLGEGGVGEADAQLLQLVGLGGDVLPQGFRVAAGLFELALGLFTGQPFTLQPVGVTVVALTGLGETLLVLGQGGTQLGQFALVGSRAGDWASGAGLGGEKNPVRAVTGDRAVKPVGEAEAVLNRSQGRAGTAIVVVSGLVAETAHSLEPVLDLGDKHARTMQSVDPVDLPVPVHSAAGQAHEQAGKQFTEQARLVHGGVGVGVDVGLGLGSQEHELVVMLQKEAEVGGALGDLLDTPLVVGGQGGHWSGSKPRSGVSKALQDIASSAVEARDQAGRLPKSMNAQVKAGFQHRSQSFPE